MAYSDPEKRRAWYRARYAKDPEKDRAKSRAWAKAHPDIIRATRRKWYLANAERRHEYQRRGAAKRMVAQAYMDSLRAGGCADCGTKHLGVLDFDHLRDKKTLVSRLWFRPFAEIDAEVAKCEVRCANCHRLMTAARRTKVL